MWDPLLCEKEVRTSEELIRLVPTSLLATGTVALHKHHDRPTALRPSCRLGAVWKAHVAGCFYTAMTLHHDVFGVYSQRCAGPGMAAFSPRAATQTDDAQPRQPLARKLLLLVLVALCCVFYDEIRVSTYMSVGLWKARAVWGSLLTDSADGSLTCLPSSHLQPQQRTPTRRRPCG